MLADANAPDDPQSQPSNSTKAALGDQRSPAFEPNGTLTAGTLARVSSVSKNVLGGTTVLTYQTGERSSRCIADPVVCLASLILLFLV